MSYNYKQLENGRWGIFINNQLVASIGCFNTCKTILQFLETRTSNQDISTLRDKHIIAPYFHEMKLRP
ncbi:hypothetical protein I4641_21160 [Waterburya agarophytonicola K14]|uniref:Uncharacterized protein n=1 Tax=Waterburya agarophytonicola KI4 TaxID=2874699 RepID=A0A964FLM7_9CYAN|nr:hypothetical protein [Waterburya agarophytonicola KI4]